MILVVYLVLAAFYAAMMALAHLFNNETVGEFSTNRIWKPQWFGGLTRLAVVIAIALVIGFDSCRLVATAGLIVWHSVTVVKGLSLRVWTRGVSVAALAIGWGAVILIFNWAPFIQQATALFTV